MFLQKRFLSVYKDAQEKSPPLLVVSWELDSFWSCFFLTGIFECRGHYDMRSERLDLIFERICIRICALLWLYQISTIAASNAYVLHMHESTHFHHHGNGCFLLVEAPPQSPQNTILYPENAAKMQRLRDFSNRLWTLNVLLFRILFPQ